MVKESILHCDLPFFFSSTNTTKKVKQVNSSMIYHKKNLFLNNYTSYCDTYIDKINKNKCLHLY